MLIPGEGWTWQTVRGIVASVAVAGVAQLAERLICNQKVVGSSPTVGSIRKFLRFRNREPILI